jgi:hypothetical protein
MKRCVSYLLAIAEAVNDASSKSKIINSNPIPFQYMKSQANRYLSKKVVDAISVHNFLSVGATGLFIICADP